MTAFGHRVFAEVIKVNEIIRVGSNPNKKRRVDTDTHRTETMGRQGKDGLLQVKIQSLGRNKSRRHLDLRLLASRIWVLFSCLPVVCVMATPMEVPSCPGGRVLPVICPSHPLFSLLARTDL